MVDRRKGPDGSTDWPPSDETWGADRTSVDRRTVFAPVAADFPPSPYPSADVLATYAAVDPDLVRQILGRIDAETDHRRQVELDVIARNERRFDLAQGATFAVAISGTLGALVAGYLGVPSLVCVAVVAFCVGGPNTATVLARVLDRRQG